MFVGKAHGFFARVRMGMANRRKVTRRIFVFVIFLSLLVVFYKVFVLYIDTRDIEIQGWGRNSNRNASLYIYPNKDTSFSHVDRKICCKVKPLVVVVVCSNTQNSQLREAIRQTWARDALVYNMLVFFLVGISHSEAVNMNTLKESIIHKDIIVEEVIENYNNLTLKSIFMLKWVKMNCAEARFLLKVDDDVYLNVTNLHNYASNVADDKMANFLVGYIQEYPYPYRYHYSKWYIPRYLFAKDEYPPYVQGGAYLMSFQVARKLYYESFENELIHIEDAFITGICAEKLGIVPKDETLFHFAPKSLLLQCDSIQIDLIVVAHYVDVYRMYKIHRVLPTC